MSIPTATCHTPHSARPEIARARIGNHRSGGGTRDASQANATTAMGNLDTLIDAVGAARGKFGSYINRLEHTITNLGNMRENGEAAKGRIMDADFALEASNMSKNQMLMQSGMSVLSNANQTSGLVMSLLR